MQLTPEQKQDFINKIAIIFEDYAELRYVHQVILFRFGTDLTNSYSLLEMTECVKYTIRTHARSHLQNDPLTRTDSLYRVFISIGEDLKIKYDTEMQKKLLNSLDTLNKRLDQQEETQKKMIEYIKIIDQRLKIVEADLKSTPEHKEPTKNTVAYFKP